MQDGAVAGFKYFQFIDGEQRTICVKLCVRGKGTMQISTDRDFKTIAAEIPVCETNGEIEQFSARSVIPDGIYPLFFRFSGEGLADFYSFSIFDA